MRSYLLIEPQIAESGLPLHAFDDFEEAADKVIELARTSSQV